MKKISVIVVVVFLTSALFSQGNTNYLKCFIGMTKNQVKNYWSTKVSDECFQEGPDFFWVLTFDCENFSGSFAGHSAFTSTFDTIKYICYEHSSKFSVKNISIITAQLKNAGYHFDEKKNGWVIANKKIIWTIEPGEIMPDGSTTTVYYITCKIYSKN